MKPSWQFRNLVAGNVTITSAHLSAPINVIVRVAISHAAKDFPVAILVLVFAEKYAHLFAEFVIKRS